MSDITRTTYHTARKAHRCAEEPTCKRGIKPGDRYARVFGLTDGQPWTERLCLRCDRLYDAAWRRYVKEWAADEHYGAPMFGSLLWWLRDARRDCGPVTWDPKTMQRRKPRETFA